MVDKEHPIDEADRSFFDGVVIAPPRSKPAKLSGVAKARGYMILGTEKRVERLRAGEADVWYEQTKDGWRGGVRLKNKEVFAFFEPSKEKLLERYESWVLPGLHAGKFDSDHPRAPGLEEEAK